MSTHSDVLIVGAGVFGTSTAYHLALSSPSTAHKITVLDRTPSPPSSAASTDINKIIRADYSSPFYCDLAYEAMDAWSTWPELKPFYHRTGWVMLDKSDSDLAERIRKVFKDRGHDPTSDVPLTELGDEKRWGGIMKGTRTEGFRDAYWNPEAGWCEASNATESMMKAAIEKGVKYKVGDVDGLILQDGGVKGIRTKHGEIHTADKIVLATGAWTSSIMSTLEDELLISEADRVERQATAAGVCVAHYKMDDIEMAALKDMPVVVYGDNGEVIPPPDENKLLKYTNANTFTNTVTSKSGHRFSAPPNQDQHIVPKKLQDETHEIMMSRVMPQFSQNKPVDHWRLCWDARTPSQDWLLSKHPQETLHNLYFAIGGSFHSYKFLPNVGKYMANVLSGEGNGQEQDHAWGWKKSGFAGRGAHEKTDPKRELRDLDDFPTPRL